MKALKKRVISIAVAVVMVLSMLPFTSVLTMADGEAVISFDDEACTVIAEDDEFGFYYYPLTTQNSKVVFPIIEGKMEEWGSQIASLDLKTCIEGTNSVDLADGFDTSYDEIVSVLETLDDDGYLNLATIEYDFLADVSNLYGVYIADDDYNEYYVIFSLPTPFTTDVGKITSYSKGAYYYEDPYGWMAPFTVDLYTLEVPFGTTEINITFDAARLAYGYNSEGYCVCGGAATDDTYYTDYTVGDTTAVFKADEDGNFPEFIHVQTPYVGYDSDTLFVIKIVVTHKFSVLVDGKEITDITSTPNGYYVYSSFEYGGTVYESEDETTLYTVYIPKGTKNVTIQLSTGGLLYNYNYDFVQTSNWLGPWYKDEIAYGGPGVTELEMSVDSNGDGAFDVIQVQKVYGPGGYGGGELLYAITFSSDEPPVAADQSDSEVEYVFGDEYEVLTQARGGTLTADNAKHYFESIIQTVTKKQSAKLNDTLPNDNAKVVLALTAAGYDARNIAGFNLVEPLYDVEYAKGSYITAAAYSLLAIDCHPNYDCAEAQAARTVLYDYLWDGLGESGIISYEGYGVSLDSTAMIIQALCPLYEEPDSEEPDRIQKAAAFILNAQTPSGGYSDTGSNTAEANSCTTAQIIITMAEFGVNPDTDLRFIQADGSTPVSFLTSCQTENGFVYQLSYPYADDYSTQQGNLGIVAYQRVAAGKTSLFNMSDVDLSKKPIQASSDGKLIVDFVDGIDKDYTLEWKEITDIPEDLAKEPNNVLKLYEIKVLDKDGKEVELKDTQIKVRLQVGNDLKKFDAYKAVYVKNGAIVEKLAATIDGEWFLFDTTHLSEYGIAGDNTPATGDHSQATLWIVLMIVALMTAAGAFVLIRKKWL